MHKIELNYLKMLSNPWGVENDSYLHDVGMLDQVVQMQAKL